MTRAQRHTVGCVRFDKRRGTWNYLFYDHGKRRSKRIGTKKEYPTKAAAWKAVGPIHTMPQDTNGETVRDVSTRYQAERMPTRHCTARVYRSFLDNHVLPKWGDTLIRDVQPRPVELWLRQLPLAPKSKTHVRSLLHSLVDFAMWAGILDVARNPISLVVNKGATKVMQTIGCLPVHTASADYPTHTAVHATCLRAPRRLQGLGTSAPTPLGTRTARGWTQQAHPFPYSKK